MEYKKFLENPNTQKYLKNYVQAADLKVVKNDEIPKITTKSENNNQKTIGQRQNEKNKNQKMSWKKRPKVTYGKNEDENDNSEGYDLKDIIEERPSTNIVREFIFFQVDNICDEEENLFLNE
jgi:hypothetical protein